MVVNSSSLQPHVCLTDNNSSTSTKLAVNVTQTAHGFTAGTVIRWNPSKDGKAYGYTAAQADDAYNAEVVGIVSKVLGSNDFELCVGGIVQMNDFFSNTTGVINPGMTSDDVFFLSGYTAGWMTTERPTTTGWVAKPVITRIAEDANGSIFGSVTNYVGSLLGGNIAVSLGNLVPVGTIQPFLGNEGSIPSGWAFCDGEGMKDVNNIPGFKISKYPEYNNVVGKRYGWVEAIYTKATPNIGDRVSQIVDGKNIGGIVVGNSGGSDGFQYIFVKQSYDNVIPMDENQNFFIEQDYLKPTRGGDGGNDEIDKQTTSFETLKEFSHSTDGVNYTIYPTSNPTSGYVAHSYTDNNSKIVGVFSILPPDLRSRTVFGAAAAVETPDSTTKSVLARKGGHERFNLDGSSQTSEDGVGGDFGLVEAAEDNRKGWAAKQSNMPPYLTVNWIVRVDPNAYASLIEKLEVKHLKLTNLPTNESGTEQWEVWRDNGTLKIDTTA